MTTQLDTRQPRISRFKRLGWILIPVVLAMFLFVRPPALYQQYDNGGPLPAEHVDDDRYDPDAYDCLNLVLVEFCQRRS